MARNFGEMNPKITSAGRNKQKILENEYLRVDSNRSYPWFQTKIFKIFPKMAKFQFGDSEKMVGIFEEVNPKITSARSKLTTKFL